MLPVVAGLSMPAQAAVWIPVPNGSFESPDTVFAQPGADFWTTTGDSTGIFENLPQDTEFPPGSGIIAKRITNAVGSQLAFIGANNPLNSPTLPGPSNEFSQMLGGVYLPGQVYELSVGIAVSSVQPPDVGSIVRLTLFYLDGLNARQTVASTPVANDAATDLRTDLLKYFTATSPVVAADAPYANHQIGIAISTADNTFSTGGTFDLDNITVPEPGTAAMLALAGLAIGARRQRGRLR